ncbi:MAG: alpha/beta hydrolase-fold protein [Ferruginibacter sp.]
MHKFLYLISIFLAGYQGIFAQYRLRIELIVPNVQDVDSFFIAGSFNNWQPADKAYGFLKNDEKLIYEKSELPSGIYEFKITRGSWDKVESTNNGTDINNRFINLSSDTIIQISVEGWKDNFVRAPKMHTASKNVHLLDSSFHMSKLGRDRPVWIYLPPDYNSGKKRYPVIYMHDGQNLFDSFTSGFGEWGVDEILDSLSAAGKTSSIVIGIDNGPHRLNEYNPYNNARFGEGEGEAYINFIIKDLKPFVDKNYRTLSAKENTIIAGSSMGGLISYYAALKYPSVFGKAGIFSPAFWIAPDILPLTDTLAPQAKGMYFFYMGEKEGEEMISSMNAVTLNLGKSSGALIYTVVDPGGKHHEYSWKKWFPEFYLWVSSNGLNHIIKQD